MRRVSSGVRGSWVWTSLYSLPIVTLDKCFTFSVLSLLTCKMGTGLSQGSNEELHGEGLAEGLARSEPSSVAAASSSLLFVIVPVSKNPAQFRALFLGFPVSGGCQVLLGLSLSVHSFVHSLCYMRALCQGSGELPGGGELLSGVALGNTGWATFIALCNPDMTLSPLVPLLSLKALLTNSLQT